MDLQELQKELNIAEQAKKYGIPLWQHPQFLFLVMGLLIIGSSVLSYILGRRYVADPEVVALAVLILALVLLVLSFIITRSFERFAEASRLKSEFVGIVSHQLRAPLSNLKWIADLLSSGKGNGNNAEYFQMLKENASRMQELVNDLLLVSKIEEGGLTPHSVPFSFSELIEKVLKGFEPVVRASNIEVQTQGDKALPLAYGDPSQIRDVVENLLENAIKYTGKTKGATLGESLSKERRIDVRYKKVGRAIRFEIEDTGVGISREDQKYLFEKFFRSGNVMRHETQGSGLGLYIAKSIIKKAGGTIGFHSTEGVGSTFFFTIPIHAS
jgi:signal transduction histidine kinase